MTMVYVIACSGPPITQGGYWAQCNNGEFVVYQVPLANLTGQPGTTPANPANGQFTIALESPDSEQLRVDMFDLFYLALASLVALWGIKRLIALFAGESKD